MKIGLIGLAGAGKDTAAVIMQRILQEQTGKYYSIERYANLLKTCARRVFGDNFDDRDVKEVKIPVTKELHDLMIAVTSYCQRALGLRDKDIDRWHSLCNKHLGSLSEVSPRLFQQLLGTEVGRAINPDVWVNYLHSQDYGMIITDCRFPNELVDKRILIIRHDVPENIHSSEEFAAKLQTDHTARLGVVDYVIHNTGTIEELETRLRFALTTL
ncbi:deoxynucleoside monophosphate kinase [Acinetobacter phage Petty]|uniref:Deoxynucleoside monophosphate kinase n=1 Tax=Acinetobacter phage Petty TaxID=1406779 RepID=U5PZG3_9CAUD|nr:deoxynucleoside monophosphate kinase [Acinetobacter phage Petty]AGY47997.1 deoxynucleoside monophosphate kinase [Acinetobacter phage Petty]